MIILNHYMLIISNIIMSNVLPILSITLVYLGWMHKVVSTYYGHNTFRDVSLCSFVKCEFVSIAMFGAFQVCHQDEQNQMHMHYNSYVL